MGAKISTRVVCLPACSGCVLCYQVLVTVACEVIGVCTCDTGAYWLVSVFFLPLRMIPPCYHCVEPPQPL